MLDVFNKKTVVCPQEALYAMANISLKKNIVVNLNFRIFRQNIANNYLKKNRL